MDDKLNIPCRQLSHTTVAVSLRMKRATDIEKQKM